MKDTSAFEWPPSGGDVCSGPPYPCPTLGNVFVSKNLVWKNHEYSYFSQAKGLEFGKHEGELLIVDPYYPKVSIVDVSKARVVKKYHMLLKNFASNTME